MVHNRNPDLFHRVGRHAFLLGVNTIALQLLQSRVAGNRLNLFCRASRFGQAAAHAFAESMCAQTKRETRFATGSPNQLVKALGAKGLPVAVVRKVNCLVLEVSRIALSAG